MHMPTYIIWKAPTAMEPPSDSAMPDSNVGAHTLIVNLERSDVAQNLEVCQVRNSKGKKAS